jgi:hypothetical protein
MKLSVIIALFCSHLMMATLGVALGIYLLPILTSPSAPLTSKIRQLSAQSNYTAVISSELKGSDFLHWGEGEFSLSPNTITFLGKLSPGPDFKLYLSPRFIESETDFLHAKSSMLMVGDVKTFENFVTNSTAPIALKNYNTVIVWCESFGEFITAAKYR